MPEETFEYFMRRYGRPDGTYPVIEVGETHRAVADRLDQVR
jgi:hypothetical protein